MATPVRFQPLTRCIYTRDSVPSRLSRLSRYQNLPSTTSRHNPEHQEHRLFSTTTRCPARRDDQDPMNLARKPPPQKSIAVAMAEQKQALEIPDDNGLMPNTFVTPVRAHLPASTDLRGWRQWGWSWTKTRAIDTLGRAITKFFYIRLLPREQVRALPWKQRWYHKLFVWYDMETRKIPGIAQTLYEEMYNSFAAGRTSIDRMRPRLCENIYDSLSSRVMSRPPNVRLEWTLHKYIGSPRVVSYRMTLMDDKEKNKMLQSTIQQAVVRIRSMQTLKRIQKYRGRSGQTENKLLEGSVVGEDGLGKEVTEYFVVQKMMRKGQPGPWMIWGTTNETTLEEVERRRRKRLGEDERE